jgi:hypothetical protein
VAILLCCICCVSVAHIHLTARLQAPIRLSLTNVSVHGLLKKVWGKRQHSQYDSGCYRLYLVLWIQPSQSSVISADTLASAVRSKLSTTKSPRHEICHWTQTFSFTADPNKNKGKASGVGVGLQLCVKVMWRRSSQLGEECVAVARIPLDEIQLGEHTSQHPMTLMCEQRTKPKTLGVTSNGKQKDKAFIELSSKLLKFSM